MSVFIIKRDNTVQEYDVKKIVNVLSMAFTNSSTVCNNMDVLVKDINDNEVVMGYPALPLKEFLKKNKS